MYLYKKSCLKPLRLSDYLLQPFPTKNTLFAHFVDEMFPSARVFALLPSFYFAPA